MAEEIEKTEEQKVSIKITDLHKAYGRKGGNT